MPHSSPSSQSLPHVEAEPNFENLLKVLRRECPPRPTLFEFFLNDRLYSRLVPDSDLADVAEDLRRFVRIIRAFRRAGYDGATFKLPDFNFARGDFAQERTHSLNDGVLIQDRASFNAYPWPDSAQIETGILDRLASYVPDGMKLILHGPGGVLENVIQLTGYDTLCFMVVDDPDLTRDVFAAVGERLTQYYRQVAPHPVIGACISNDDWGFKTQTMLPPAHMREYVFPWHTRIVEAIHDAGKPAILHSCGYFDEVIDDVIDTMCFDARHSYEDAILPVEEAYDRYGERIAILGGIDVDFICRSTPEQIYERSREMLRRTAGTGGYALGSGNSIPDYVPDEKYFAMIRAATETR